ncbi:MAG TPA: hypothetical protein VH019_06620 [Rhizomicrobium sp.]|jgi:hypothetical protein|nr:hypothetical protein [Rhizomicrobium sp.]
MGPPKQYWKRYIFGAAIVIALAAGAIHNELLGPVIHADPIRADDPLTIRFVLFNPAFTVTLRNVDMNCVPLSLNGRGKDGRAWTAHGQPFPLNVDIDIGPRAAFEYTCPIQDSGFPGAVTTVMAQIAIRYTRFGRRDQATSGTLAWDSASRVWTVAGR